MKIVLKAAEVAEGLGEYLIVDARSREEYEKSHVAGARHLPGNQHLKNGDVMISGDEFAALMSSIGAGNHSKILVYDDGNGRNPARFWFVAKHYGHKDVFVLDGGWPAVADLPQNADVPHANPSNYSIATATGFITNTQDILDNFDKIKLLDVRTLDEYTGRDLVDNPRGGHIPGAANINFIELLDTNTDSYFVPPDKITSLLAGAGIVKDDFVVTY